MRVLHVVKGFGVEAGGIAVSHCRLAEAQARLSHEVRLLSFADGAECVSSEEAETEGRVKLLTERLSPLDCWFGRCSPLDENVFWADIVHVAGLWRAVHHATFRTAYRRSVPVVVAPQGMLEPWALGHHGWKKRLALSVYLGRDLKRVSCLHAVCEAEARNLRALGLNNPIAIVPNGIDLSPFGDMPTKSRMDQLFPELKNRQLILFLGRIHPKKGLPHTIRAWAGLANRFSDWDLVVAGWDQGGHIGELQRLSKSLGINERVHFVGPVAGVKKYALLGNSELFVLSSFSEGFSVAILEAMAAGVPVILTPTCNFPEAQEAGAAVLVEPTAESTATGLEGLLRLSSQERGEMGERGRLLVEQRFTPEKVARMMIDVYNWILHGGSPPPWVVVGRHPRP